MTKKSFFAPSTLGLGAMRRAAMTLLLAMLTATTAWAQGYNFIDADGTVHNTATEGITVTEINASNMPTTLTSGWYVVTENVNYTSGINGVTTSGTYDITIILVNGKTMNIGSAGTPISDMSGLQCGQLTIYGQSLDPATAGSLNVYTNRYDGIHTATNYYQNSGNVSVTSNYNGAYGINAAVHAERDFALNCGKLTANGTNGHGVVANNVAVLGGQLDAISNDNNFFGIFSYTYITFMWKHVSDYIHVSSYCGDNSVGITAYKHFWTDDATPVNISSNVDDASTLSGKTLTPDYSAHFSVNDAGTEYTIHTADGWSVFCDALQDNDTWNRFSGKTVKLGDNITVTRMAGGSYHDFCGTFDGQGNTLTVNISSDDITDGSTQYVAPFRYVSNTKADPSDEADSPATIRNLHVTGTITTDKQFTGGLIGGCWGTVIVENCRVSTAITSTISGDGTHGGIVGIQQNGALTITGCLFDGSLLGATTYAVGGFIGWRKSGAEIRNSLFAPAEVTVLNTSGATFARNKVDTYNSYYTYYLCDGTNYVPYDPADADHPDKYNNGHMRRTITAGDNVTIGGIALTATATGTDAIGIYGTALTLGWTRPDDRITASSISAPYGGTVAVATGQALTDGSGNIYTGTLTDDEISAIAGKTLRPCISYLDSDGETQYCADYTVLTGDETTLAAGWYFVGKDIDNTATITLDGDVSLILADGCTMHIGSSGSRINGNGIAHESLGDQALTIYGQTAGTGTLSIYTDNGNNGIVAKAVTINGGNVTIDANGKWSTGILTGDGNIIINSGNVNVTATDDNTWGLYANGNGNVNVNGGNVNATGGSSGIRTDNGDIAINGGNVTATGSNNGIHSLNGGITLGYTNPTDYILSSSISTEDGTVAVATGQALTDGTSTYSGTLTDDEISAIAGKTLRPVATMDNIPDQTYTGSEIKPEPLVMAGSLNLTKGTDYEYSYTDNVNVGTAKVTVTFKGDYASLGSVEKEFNIVRATPTVTAPTANTLTYNGNEQELVTAGSTDFGKVLYSLDGTNYSKDIPKATDAGTYTVYYKVDTDNYFYAPQTVEVTIAEESKTEPITTQISYVTANGQASEEVTAIVLDENTVIDEDFDWSQPVYYVTGDVVYSDAYFMFSNPNGVTLILADDANLNVGTIMTYHPYEDGSTEYGTYDVIITKAVGAEGVGKISSQIICKNFVQYAGQLTGIVGAFGDSTGEDADYQGTITLDFADESASANIVTYYEEMRLCDSFIIPDGKALTDGTNIYTGTLSADDLTAISGQTLRPCLVLADDIIGDETLANNDGMTLTVALANRTIDTEWNTIALPFDVSAEQLTETFGTGVKLYELSGSTLDNGVLGLEFASATSIEAGKPYFIKASADVVNPTFQSVTIDASANNPSATDYVDFIPTLGVTTVEGSDLREVLVLGAGNTLYNPSVLPAMMKGFRGFFRVHDEVVANAAQFRMSFAEESEISGIFRVAGDNGTDGCIYNLMGQRVNRADKGLFIVNGKRVIRP